MAESRAIRRNRAVEALYSRLSQLPVKDTFFRRIDDKHAAAYAGGNETLVVSFERVEPLVGEDGDMPFGRELQEEYGWSFLSVLANGQTWYRSEEVYAFFDELIDDGFFDNFERVIFFGASTSAHAACAFSVAAPGATVIAISPQATLAHDYASFDTRFNYARRLDFSSRFGYAPDMLDGCREAHIFFDPEVTEDAAHAAQFSGKHVKLHRLRRFGQNPVELMTTGDTLVRLFGLVDKNAVTDAAIGQLMRDRRTHFPYLKTTYWKLIHQERDYLAAVLCYNVAERMNHSRFRRWRDALGDKLEAEGKEVPWAEKV